MNTIDVLIPVYNGQKTLADCLESLVAQTDPRFHSVIVNDGSRDGTREILDKIARQDPRFTVIHFPENRGIVAALNEGLRHCRNPWIARMDADDIMMPNRLQVQMAAVRDRPEIQLLGCGYRLFRDFETPTPGQRRYQDWSNRLLTDEAIKAEIFVEAPICHPTFFVRRTLYQKLGGYRDHPWAEDYDFLLRAAEMGAVFEKLPEILVAKRDGPDRLYRVDPRCKRPAMTAAKAHYFARKFRRDGLDQVWILGSGSSGRSLAKALLAEKVPVAGFLDRIEGPPGRTVMGLPTNRWQTVGRHTFGAKKTLILLCVGHTKGRSEVETHLQDQGFRLSEDYIPFF